MHWPTETEALLSESTDDVMDPHLTQAEQPARSGPPRFTYAGGSRPLAGYTIKRGIGRGGFGEVYFAVSDGGKEVALKLIRHNLEVELRGVAHCLNLKHPNLIALYDVKQDEHENSWVIMEYAVGDSLEEVLDRNPNGLPQDEALNWLQGMSAGVAYLHDHGIVHRDLKPGNIFRDDGQVKLGDYGLSKFISCSRRSGQTESIGTVHYMAPEVANGRYGKEIDIYALGIILYEMLTGKVPFEGESVGEVLMKHLTAEPQLDGIPAAYRQVIARCLAKDPATRFGSVAEMCNALPPLAATTLFRQPLLEPKRAESPAGAAAAAPDPTAQPQPQAPEAPIMATLVSGTAGSTVDPVQDEPIWRAISESWRVARDRWDGMNTPTKLAVAVVGCAALSFNAELVLSLIVPLAGLYVLYLVVRAVVQQQDQRRKAELAGYSPQQHAAPRTPPVAQPVRTPPVEPRVRPGSLDATTYQPLAQPTAPPHQGGPPVARGDWRAASQRHWKRKSLRRRGETALNPLVKRSPRERLADLAGAMLLAAIVGAVMSIVAVLISGNVAVEKNQFAWLALTSVLGVWAVLIPTSLWTGREGDQTLRRVMMLVVGMLVGVAAHLGATLLLVQLNPSADVKDFVQLGLSKNYYDAQGLPQLGAYVIYFGALFAGIRWWRQADPLRRTRLSVWNVGAAVLCAWVVNWIWQFPQPWGLMMAAITSTSVQLAAPQVDRDAAGDKE
jgi:hypothetical protein